MVIRDDKGRVEAALCRKIIATMGVVEVEAKAFEVGLLFALCDTSPPPSSIASVVLGMQEMSKEFRRLEFSHVRRQGNRIAHLLAKHASIIVDYIAWIGEDPCCIEQALIHDVTSFSHLQ